MRRPAFIDDAARAITLLTALPVPAQAPRDGEGANTAGWFPAVGLGVGAVGYAFASAARFLPAADYAPLLVAAVVVTLWALCTRLLHWDGLADVADGYWGSHDLTRRLEIMSDSHTGAFGAAAVSLTAIVEVAAIAAVFAAGHELPLLVVPVLARLAATFAAWLGKPARPGGLGRSVMGKPGIAGLLPAVVVVAAVLGAFTAANPGVSVMVLAGAGVVVAAGVPHVLSQRFGGVTGDVMGASVLLTEAVLFVLFALAL